MNEKPLLPSGEAQPLAEILQEKTEGAEAKPDAAAKQENHALLVLLSVSRMLPDASGER